MTRGLRGGSCISARCPPPGRKRLRERGFSAGCAMARSWPGLLCLCYCLWTLCIGVAGGESDPADWEAVCALTHPAVAALRPRDHIRIYRMCVRLRPFDIEARMGLAEQLASSGDTASSAHVLHGVLALPVNAAAALDAHNALGVIMDTHDRAQQAERHLRAALSINPAYTPALTNLGNCLWKQRRAHEALALFDRALRLEPFEAGHHYSLAAAQFEAGQPTTAVAGFKRALALSPSNAPALLGLGHASRDLQDPSAAAAAYAAAFDIMAAGTQEASMPARTHASPGQPGDAAGAVECAVGPAAMQAKLLEFSARLAAGDHCHLPVDMSRACLLAASASALTPSAPHASPTFIGDFGEEVVWANMYDVAQLVGPDVIKRLAIARGSALERQAARLLLRHAAAWMPAPPASPLPARAHAWLDVVLLSASLDGDHYVTHAVLNLVNALYAPEAHRSAANPRLRVHVISTAEFAAHPPHSAAEDPSRDRRHWGCSQGGAGAEGGGSAEWTRSCVMARLASAVEERGGSAVAAHAWSDLDIAMYINSKVRGHVLFHLDGYARRAPVGVAAAQPTPVAALWLGYTGTLGMRTSVTHTLVDRVLVPPEYASHLSEKSVFLPGSLSALIMRNYTALLQHPPFLPAPCPPPGSTASLTPPAAGCQGSEADDRLCEHIVAGIEGGGASPGEAGARGLNRSGVVAANFNSLYKIGPRSVRLWSQALSCAKPLAASAPKKCVPRQMWIARRPRVAADRIAAALEAQAVSGCPLTSGREGGDGDMQVVASEMPGAHEHVRVKSCADLFIDSLEVGAHSTAADALAAGLPVLTTAGSAVSQRVAASLLRAGALLHTLARDPDDMLEVARHLVASKQRLRALRVTLSRRSRQHLQHGVLGRHGCGGSGDNAGAAGGGGHRGCADGGRELWDAHLWAQAFLRLVGLLWETHDAYAGDAPVRKELHVVGASIHGRGR